jgi:tetratricopeptide (TPR) repeat protein
VAAGSSSADTWLLAAATQLRIGEFARARASTEAAARLAPDMAAAYTLSGIARERVGDEEGAKGAYWQALKKNPDDFDANLHLGSILYELRELDGAQVCILRALKVDPTSMVARYQMALLKIAQDHLQEALADLEAIAHQAPEWLQPHVQLVALYYRLRRPADGARERQIVDRLMVDQQKQNPGHEPAVRGAFPVNGQAPLR